MIYRQYFGLLERLLIMKKRLIAAIGGLVLLGAGGGFVVKLATSNNGGTTSVVDIEDESVLNKYIEMPSKKVSEYLEEDSSNSYKNVLYATNTMFAKKSKYIVTSSKGTVQASVAGIPYNQEVANKRIINDQDTFFQTNTISTFVKKSEQRYTNSNSYLVREGSSPTLEGADYSSSQVEALSKKDYMNRYGHTHRDIFNYAINDNSFVSGTYQGLKEDGLYYFNYKLDANAATAAYVREVAYMAGSSSYPVFSEVSLTIAINEDYQIQKSYTNENYTTPIMGGLNCSGSFEETYTYYTSNVDCPEKAVFEPYFGQETGVIEKEKSAMDYLSTLGDDMSVFSNFQLKGNIKLNDEDLDLKVKLDIPNNSYSVDIDDKLDIFYTNENAYVISDNSSYLVSKEELNKVIKLVAGEQDLINSDTLMKLMENPFVSKILGQMSVDKDDKYVNINIPFDDTSKIVLHLYDDNSKVTILGLDANMVYQNYTLVAKFDVVSDNSLIFKEIPSSVKEVNNISPIVTKVKDIVETKGFYGEINFNKELNINSQIIPLSISGNYYVDLKNSNNPLYKFDLVLSINSNNINLTIDGNKVKLYVQIGDNFKAYTSYEDLINLINGFITPDITIPSIEIEQMFNLVVDVIDNLDFYQDYVTFNLGGLNISLLNGTIKLSHSDNLTLSYNDDLNITLIPYEDSLNEVEYLDALNLNDVANEIISSLEKCSYNITIDNFTYQDLSLDGEIKLSPDLSSITNSSMEGNLEVNYKDINLNIQFYFVHRKLYLTINNEKKFYISYDEAKELFNQYFPDVSLPSIDLTNIDFASIINSLFSSKNEIRMDLESINNNLNYDLVFNLENKDIVLTTKEDNVNKININTIDDFKINVDESEYVSLKSIIDTLVTNFNKLLDSRKFSGCLKLENISLNIKLSDIYSLLGIKAFSSDSELKLISNININYQLDLEDKFDFYLDIGFNVHNIVNDTSKGGAISLKSDHLIITKVDKNIYFKLSNIVSFLSYEEWINVIKYFVNEFNIDNDIDFDNIKTTLDELSKGIDSFKNYLSDKTKEKSSFDVNSLLDLISVNDLINSISYTSLGDNDGELYFSISLSKILEKYDINFISLDNIGVTYNTLNGQILLSDSIEGSLNYLNVDTSSIDKINASNYVTYSSLISVIDQLVALKSTLKQKQFVITTSSDATSNYVSKDNKDLFSYSGKIILDLSSGIKFSANNVIINAYSYDEQGNKETSSHNFSLTYLPTYINNGETISKDSLFINYGPNLKGYLSRSEFASLAQYGCDLMGINSSLLNGLLSNLGSADSLDSSILNNITGSTTFPNFDINLDNLFESYQIVKDDNGSSFEITLNAIDFYSSLYGEDFNKDNLDPNKNHVTLKVNSNSDRTSISKLKLSNMYSSSQEVFNIDLDISNTISDEDSKVFDPIDVTNTNNELGKYYYIGNIPTLLKAFINTANLSKYHVSGSFDMALGKWNLQDISYDAKIVLDENNKPYIEVTFNVNKLALVMNGGQSKLLYSPLDNKVYLRNNKSKTNKVYTTTDSSADDYIGKSSNIAEIINVILGSTALISSTIKSSVANTESNIDINTILKNYSYVYDESTLTGSTNVTLDGSQLMSSLSSLNLHLINQELDMQIDEENTKHGDYLTSFTFDTKMSVISLSGNGSFNNVSEITNNINVDMDLINNAINNPTSWSF